jgi:hypothetical protein
MVLDVVDAILTENGPGLSTSVSNPVETVAASRDRTTDAETGRGCFRGTRMAGSPAQANGTHLFIVRALDAQLREWMRLWNGKN